MMYLSSLLINVGNNPDRPRPGRFWLRNLNSVHQRICMAFPSAKDKVEDPHFLKPYDPTQFARKQVRVERGEDAGFLFRIDPESGGRVVILVQSAMEPDWDYAFHNADYLLAAPPQMKSFEYDFEEGQEFLFRLLANPTKRIGKVVNGNPVLKGKRVGLLHEEEQIDWLIRKSHNGGFELLMKEIEEPDGRTQLVPRVTAQREGKRKGYKYEGDTKRVTTHLAVRFDGLLRITDADEFRKTLIKGIGPAKAFGFGLLSLARA